MLNTQKVADLLNVTKKTLIQWEKEGKWVPIREPHSNIRLYDEKDVLNHVKWFELRRKHKAHLKLLEPINKERNKYIHTIPLNPGENPKCFPLEDMKKAFEAIRKWEEEERVIMEEYDNVTKNFMPKVNPYY